MPTLEDDTLVFRFPHLDRTSSFRLDFQRTLRIPDSDRTYALPPGFGAFPLRHAEDFASTLPDATRARGGVILPIWQAEAMWLNFENEGPGRGVDFPVAVKVAAGKINAVTGKPWTNGLSAKPQDYMVSPEQPWLDGFAIEPNVIRQFVAMPLGQGYSVEGQLTGEEVWGGLQISVTPLKRTHWEAYRREAEQEWEWPRMCEDVSMFMSASSMGLAAGGKMQQKIERDPFGLDAWDMDATDRVFVSLINAHDWKAVTGEAAPTHPPSAQDYAREGLPWFELYGKDQAPLQGGAPFRQVKSLAQMFEEKTGAALPGSTDVQPGPVRILSQPSRGPRPVRSTSL